MFNILYILLLLASMTITFSYANSYHARYKSQKLIWKMMSFLLSHKQYKYSDYISFSIYSQLGRYSCGFT